MEGNDLIPVVFIVLFAVVFTVIGIQIGKAWPSQAVHQAIIAAYCPQGSYLEVSDFSFDSGLLVTECYSKTKGGDDG